MCRRFFWGQKKDERKVAWVAWSKMYKSKKNGGLGMRNLQMFNAALLTKQAWRVIKFPESLMARTLKNKYFPNTSFMEAKKSPVASFTWRSILSARDLLHKGLRKVVGNGQTVDIWEDPWVPGLQNFRPHKEANHEELGPRTVSELLTQKNWNRLLLQQLFQPWEVTAIMKIPVPQEGGVDKWAWHHSKNGEFTVRSAYYVAMNAKFEEAVASSSSTHGTIWNKLWHSKIPEKLKLFEWRAMHNGIAVKESMKVRGLGNDMQCPVCGEAEETIMHTLVMCDAAKEIWRLSPLRLQVEDVRARSLKQWCDSLVSLTREEPWWALFWQLLWGIWLRRNAWVFNQKRTEVKEVIDNALRASMEYMGANESLSVGLKGEKGSRRWQHPSEGTVKVNSDAAVFDSGHIGWGGVVRNELGEVRVACCGRMEGGYEADVAEAIAARFVMKVAWEAGCRRIIMESD